MATIAEMLIQLSNIKAAIKETASIDSDVMATYADAISNALTASYEQGYTDAGGEIPSEPTPYDEGYEAGYAAYVEGEEPPYHGDRGCPYDMGEDYNSYMEWNGGYEDGWTASGSESSSGYEEGYEAGYNDYPNQYATPNPYTEGTPEADNWGNGYNDGYSQAESDQGGDEPEPEEGEPEEE